MDDDRLMLRRLSSGRRLKMSLSCGNCYYAASCQRLSGLYTGRGSGTRTIEDLNESKHTGSLGLLHPG